MIMKLVITKLVDYKLLHLIVKLDVFWQQLNLLLCYIMLV